MKNFRMYLFRGNNFATIKNFRKKVFYENLLVRTCFRGNDFETIKNFRKNISVENFL